MRSRAPTEGGRAPVAAKHCNGKRGAGKVTFLYLLGNWDTLNIEDRT